MEWGLYALDSTTTGAMAATVTTPNATTRVKSSVPSDSAGTTEYLLAQAEL